MTRPGVIVFGEVLADIFPDESMLGGAPFNVARHLQAFGAHPLLITRTGNDGLRQRFLQTSLRYGMDTSGLQLDETHPTGQVNVLMDEHGHHFEIADDQAYDYIDAQVSLAAISALESQAPIIYFGTLAQRHAVSRHALEAVLEYSTGKKFLDINLREPWYDEATIRLSLQHADIVKMNEDELTVVAGILQLQGTSPEIHARILLERFELEALIVTSGPDGAWQVDYRGQIHHTAAQAEKVTVLDTVGAGDAFAAAYLLGLIHQWPIDTRLARANQLAGAVCQIRGGVPDNADFYKQFLSRW